MERFIIKKNGRHTQIAFGITTQGESYWNPDKATATEVLIYQYSTQEEAQAVVDFIANVIDYELSDQLTIHRITD